MADERDLGRVDDADGDPVGRVQVLALRLVYDGGKQVMTIAQTVTTNDWGEYRMFWLTPGAYRVAARAFEAGLLMPAVTSGLRGDSAPARSERGLS